MELTEAIFERRSVRRFTDHVVTNEEIKEILEAARFAPSWANTQCWEFIVVRDKELIEKVTDTYSETNPARKCSAASSAIIVGCAHTTLAGYKQGDQRSKFPDWFMYDLASAVQNLCLRAHELGLGSVIVGSLDHDACNSLLKVPEGYEAVVAIPLGKPEGEPKKAPRRKELGEFVYDNYFGEKISL